jgi:WD40 repeat protein
LLSCLAAKQAILSFSGSAVTQVDYVTLPGKAGLAALLPDGRVIFPSSAASETVYIYDPSSDSVDTISGLSGLDAGVFVSYVLPDGRVIFVPAVYVGSAGTKVYVLDLNSQAVTVPNITLPSGSPAFSASALLPDGGIFLSPYYATSGRVIHAGSFDYDLAFYTSPFFNRWG